MICRCANQKTKLLKLQGAVGFDPMSRNTEYWFDTNGGTKTYHSMNAMEYGHLVGDGGYCLTKPAPWSRTNFFSF